MKKCFEAPGHIRSIRHSTDAAGDRPVRFLADRPIVLRMHAINVAAVTEKMYVMCFMTLWIIGYAFVCYAR